MNDENTEKLFKEFPLLYKDLDYFECGDGWFALIYELSEKLEKLILKHQKETQKDEEISFCYATQVKEKFGSLRFYLTCKTDEMKKEVERAEEQSEKICEICGAPGKIESYSVWRACRCEGCK